MTSFVKCRLCPKHCRLADGARGNCRVRMNRDGQLISLVYGKALAIHVDPVEKKPLFHFLPGTRTFSLGTAGCNLHCAFCQNWQISQINPEDAEPEDYPPAKVISTALQQGCPSISCTYNEPIAFFEYAVDIGTAARKAGLKTVMITAGYIEQEPLIEMCRITDAANVDIKSFSDDFYDRIVDGHLQPVLNAVETMHKLGVWVEITNMIIPGENDDMGMIADMCRWIRDKIGPFTPLHFSRFSPLYKMSERLPTPPETLMKAAETAVAAGLKHIYVGNMDAGDFAHTWCPACSKKVIERRGYEVTAINVNAEGVCAFCGQKINGVWR